MTSKKRNVLSAMLLMLSLTLQPQLRAQEPAGGTPANVESVGFKYESPRSRLEIVLDKEVTFEKNISEADKQVIVDIPNARIAKKWTRRLETFEHKTNVAMISPYQSENRVRITLQLKENGGVELSQDGKRIIVAIDNKQPAEQAKTDPAAPAADATPKADVAETPKTDPVAAPAPEAVAATSNPTPPEATSDSLEGFFKSQDSRQWVGKHIFLQVQDTDLADVFRVISEASEFNIVLTDNVKGKVMLNLTDVPWDQALDLILRSYHLAAERQGNVLRITTQEAYAAEAAAELAARKTQEAVEPLVVKIFPISYARIGDLKTIIMDFMTKEEAPSATGPGNAPSSGITQAVASASSAGGTSGGAAGPKIRGSIQVDARTNSLVIRDTPSGLEKIKRIIKELDAQTPQILIEGKFVDVSETASKTVDGRIFASSREFDSTGSSASFKPGNNNFMTNFNSAGPAIFSATDISGIGGMGLGFSPKTKLLPGIGEISAFISILEGEGQAKTIASPRVVAQNKEKAQISQGQTLHVLTAAGVGGTGGLQKIDVNLTLEVTPQVTNDGSIQLEVSFKQSSLDSAIAGAALSTAGKTVETKVVVDSGATIVIGGVYQNTSSSSEAGIPILRNLPIIGALFGTKVTSNKKSELFIFLTPRVLNEKEAGIKG